MDITQLREKLLRRPLPVEYTELVNDAGAPAFSNYSHHWPFELGRIGSISGRDSFNAHDFMDWDDSGNSYDAFVEAIETTEREDGFGWGYPLSGYGDQVEKAVRRNTFVDLYCGNPKSSYWPRVIAHTFGAKAYIGVDIGSGFDMEDQALRHEFPNLEIAYGSFTAYYLKDHVINFLGRAVKLEEAGRFGNAIFFVSGISHLDHPDALLTETARLAEKGGGFIIGPGTGGLNPESYGFRKVAQSRNGSSLYLI